MKTIREIYVNMKKSSYNLVTKLENFTQAIAQLRNHDSVAINIMGTLARCFSEIHVPLYETYKGETQESMIPCIAQVAETIEKENFNGVFGKVVVFLASDGKQYRFRLQKYAKSDKKEGAAFDGP